jgi:VEFS-Box of polycomb protein
VDKIWAWDVEAVFANTARYPLYNYDAVACKGQSTGIWRTTRFVTRHLNLVADTSKPAFLSKRDACRTPTEARAVTYIRPGSDLVGLYARQTLFDYSRRRFVSHLRAGGVVGQDFLDDYVALVNFGRPSDEECRDSDICENSPGLKDSLIPSSGRSPPSRNRQLIASTASNVPKSYGLPLGNGGIAKIKKPKKNSDATALTTRKTGKFKFGTGSGVERKAFPSVEAGIQREILYQSVVQSRLTLEGFDAGEDSDGDDIVVDEHWRLELNDRTVAEYQDTSAPEKMYMNLWNRFAMCEFFVYSDRRLLQAVSTFARQYGAVLEALRLEVIFFRHLTELSKLGLLDAAGIHATVLEFGKAKTAAENRTENMQERLAKFEFLARVLSEDAK